MAQVVTSIINTSGNGVLLDSPGEGALITPTGQVISQASAGIQSTSYDHDITVLGMVWGNVAGIRQNANTAVVSTDIMIGSSGFVGSDNYAIDTDNDYTYVTNNGDIMGEGGIRHSGVILRVNNFGLIAAGTFDAIVVDTDAGLQLDNHGDISINSGSKTAIFGVDAASSVIENFGTITALSSAIDMRTVGSNSLYNAGTINGNVSLTASGFARVDMNNSGSMVGGSFSAYSATDFVNSGYIEGSVRFFVGDNVVTNTGHIADYVLFDAGDDVFRNAGEIDSHVYLGSGSDVFVVADGTVDGLVSGETGTDTLDLSEFGAGIWADLGTSTAWNGEVWTRDDNGVTSGGWRKLYDTSSFENVTLSAYADVIFGTDGDNLFRATDFTPVHSGTDRLNGGAGMDVVDYSALGKGLWFNLNATGGSVYTKYTDNVLAAGDWTKLATMTGIEGAVGSVGIDDIRGSAADETFWYRGSQQIAGVEQVEMNGGRDTVSFSEFGYAVWIDLSYTAGAEAQTRYQATVNGSGAWHEIADLNSVENITGSYFWDKIYGDAGDNIINGERGNDILRGRGGNDTFVFVGNDNYYAGHDTIIDFSSSDGEKIDLSDLAAITSFTDLMTSHLTTGTGGHAQITFTGGSILLEGWTTADFGTSAAISADDFIF